MNTSYISQLLQYFYEIHEIEIFGIGLDNFLHFFIGGLVFYLFQKKYTPFKCFLILTAFVLLKELIDTFGCLKLDTINNPIIDTDTLMDIIASYAGAVCVYIIKNVKGEENLKENFLIKND